MLYLLALAQRQMRRIRMPWNARGLERHHPGASGPTRSAAIVTLRSKTRAGDRGLRARGTNQSRPASRLEHARGALPDARERRARVSARPRTSPGSNRCRRRSSQLPALFCEGDLTASERLIRAFLLRHGNHVEAMRLLARIAIARDILDDAEVLLAGALAMAPDYIELRRTCLRHAGPPQACRCIAELDKLLALDPNNVDYRTLHATATVDSETTKAAFALSRRARGYRPRLTPGRRSASVDCPCAEDSRPPRRVDRGLQAGDQGATELR